MDASKHNAILTFENGTKIVVFAIDGRIYAKRGEEQTGVIPFATYDNVGAVNYWGAPCGTVAFEVLQ